MAKFKIGDKLTAPYSSDVEEVIFVGDSHYFLRDQEGFEWSNNIINVDGEYTLKPVQYIVELRVPQDGEQYFSFPEYGDEDARIVTSLNRYDARPVIVGTV